MIITLQIPYKCYCTNSVQVIIKCMIPMLPISDLPEYEPSFEMYRSLHFSATAGSQSRSYWAVRSKSEWAVLLKLLQISWADTILIMILWWTRWLKIFYMQQSNKCSGCSIVNPWISNKLRSKGSQCCSQSIYYSAACLILFSIL